MVVDHGDEEQLTVLLPEVTALVIHVVPVIARMGSFTRSRPARGLCPNPKEGDHGSQLAGRVGCGDAPPLALLPSMHSSVAEQQGPKPGRCDRFQLGAGDPGWTLQLFDLATWRVTGVAKWRSGSGFERYLRDRCPEVLEKIRHLQDRAPVKMFEAFVQEAGPFVNHLVHKGLARLQNGHMMMNDKGIIQLEAGDVLP